MFNIINLATGEPVDEIVKTGREAAIKAATLSIETGVKHQPRKIVENSDWENRERNRFLDGVYDKLPVGDKIRAFLDRHNTHHYLHLSDKRPMLAYTKNAQMGAADRQTRVTAKQYLEQYFPRIGPTNRQKLIDAIEHDSAQKVKFATTPNEITKVYTNYDPESPQVSNSCMRYRFDKLIQHPCSIYGAGDLAIAYLINSDDRVTHRALCWPKKKVYSRVYGEGDKLHVALKSLGYSKSGYYASDGSFEGARLLKIPCGSCDYIMPYIDEELWATIEGEYFILTMSNGHFKAKEVSGTTCDENNDEDEDEDNSLYCGRCEDNCEDNYVIYISQRYETPHLSQSWCYHCRENYSFQCDGTGVYYDSDQVDCYIMPHGVVWSEGYFNLHGGTCDRSNEHYPNGQLSKVILLDGGTETWGKTARDKEAFLKNGVWYEREKEDSTQTTLQFEPQEGAPCCS